MADLWDDGTPWAAQSLSSDCAFSQLWDAVKLVLVCRERILHKYELIVENQKEMSLIALC